MRLQRLAARLGTEPKVILGALTLAVMIAVTTFVFTGLLQRLTSENGEVVRATFSDTSELKPGARVRVNGVDVGEVKEVTVNRGGSSATIEMAVFKKGLPLYADATAAIRWRNALGGTLVVDLERGTRTAGELRSRVIPLNRTDSQVELDPLISVIRGATRAGFRSMLAEVPQALRDQGTLSRALRTLGDVSPGMTRGVRALRGRREGDLRRLVSTTARTVRALDNPDELRNLIEGGAVTLETTAGREADVRSTIAQAARVEPRVTETLDRLDSTLALADPLIAGLRGPAAQVAPTISRLRPVVVQAERLLSDARPLLHSLRPAATSLARAARVGLPFLREIGPSLVRLDEKIFPGLAKPDPGTGFSTYQTIGPWAAGFLGATGHFDKRGYFIRFPSGAGERAVGGSPCQPYLTDPDSPEALRCKTLEEALGNFFTWKPVPPGGAR